MSYITVNEEPAEASWLLLRPSCLRGGGHVWAVVRMPKGVVYGWVYPCADSPDFRGLERFSETEAQTLRVAWEEVRNGEMDITLPYRIDGDEIGPG